MMLRHYLAYLSLTGNLSIYDYTKLSSLVGFSLLDVKQVFFAVNVVTSDMAMQVLFFSTIIANLVGRTLPKWKMFAIKSPTFLMYLGFVKLAAAPLCFVYLKSSNRWHSDAGAAGEHSFWCHGQTCRKQTCCQIMCISMM